MSWGTPSSPTQGHQALPDLPAWPCPRARRRSFRQGLGQPAIPWCELCFPCGWNERTTSPTATSHLQGQSAVSAPRAGEASQTGLPAERLRSFQVVPDKELDACFSPLCPVSRSWFLGGKARKLRFGRRCYSSPVCADAILSPCSSRRGTAWLCAPWSPESASPCVSWE